MHVRPHFYLRLVLVGLTVLLMQGCTLLASIAKEKARQNCEQNRSIEDYQRCRGQPGLPPPEAKP